MFQNNKIYKESIYKNIFLREYNTCEVQPQFDYEIFQLNVRPKKSKESNFQKKIKNFVVGS